MGLEKDSSEEETVLRRIEILEYEKEMFKRMAGDILIKFGYEEDYKW